MRDLICDVVWWCCCLLHVLLLMCAWSIVELLCVVVWLDLCVCVFVPVCAFLSKCVSCVKYYM